MNPGDINVFNAHVQVVLEESRTALAAAHAASDAAYKLFWDASADLDAMLALREAAVLWTTRPNYKLYTVDDDLHKETTDADGLFYFAREWLNESKNFRGMGEQWCLVLATDGYPEAMHELARLY